MKKPQAYLGSCFVQVTLDPLIIVVAIIYTGNGTCLSVPLTSDPLIQAERCLVFVIKIFNALQMNLINLDIF